MKYVATETVKGTVFDLLGLVDELSRKIKESFQLSEKEIASDPNLAKEIAGDDDFMKGAVVARGDIRSPKLIKKVPPVYPEKAAQKRVEGIVIVQARTNEQGKVEAVKVIRSIPLLDQAVIDAIKQWEYEPLIHDGNPTPVVFAVTVIFKGRDDDETGLKWKKSIAVLPFADLSPDKDQEYFCDGLTEELINRLTKIERLRIPARASAFSFKGKERDFQEIGEQLDVEMVLDGSVRKAGEKLRITIQLVNVSDGFPVWSETYQRNLQDTFTLWDDISLAVVDNMKIELLGEEKARLMKRYTDNLEAYNLYFQGRYFWNRRTEDGLKKAIDYFEQALKLDPNYAIAYTGMADAYSMLSAYGFLAPNEAMPKAKAAALNALEIDKALAEAYTSLAHIKERYDFDWRGSEEDYKRAIELNPNYPLAHQWYGSLLKEDGRFHEAYAEIRRALELDPLSIPARTSFAEILRFLGEHDESIAQSKITLEMDPDYAWAHLVLAMAYSEKAMHNEAIAEFQKAAAISRGFLPALAHAYAMAGEKEKALEILEELITQSRQKYLHNYGFASIYAGLGEKDKAFEYLEKAYESRDRILSMVKISPPLESLRSDPRFKAFLKKMGLE
jgi:TonB family protein